MKSLRTLAILSLLAFVATPAVAQTDFWFQGSTSTVSAWGARVGPYQGKLGGPGSPTIDVFCVDYLHSAGGSWQVFESSLAGDLSNTYAVGYGVTQAAALERYKKAAWLATKFGTTPMANPEWGGLHGAIWSVMSGGTANQNRWGGPNRFVGSAGGAIGDRSQYWLTKLNNACPADGDCWQNINLSEWTVLSDVNGPYNSAGGYAGRQEYLVRNVVPEPETLVLLGSGLLALGLIFYYRRGMPV